MALIIQHGLCLPRTVEELKHGIRRKCLLNQPVVPVRPTNRNLPTVQWEREAPASHSGGTDRGLRSLPSLRGKGKDRRSGSDGYAYAADGTPVNVYSTASESEPAQQAIRRRLDPGYFLPIPRKPRFPKFTPGELKRSPDGMLWGLSTPGDPADPTFPSRPGPSWSPEPWKVAGAGRFVDAKTGKPLDYDKTLWAIQQIRKEVIDWAFKRNPGDWKAFQARNLHNRERFASLPPRLRLMAWAKFSELWERSKARGQSRSIDRARVFGQAARIIKYRYLIGIDNQKYGAMIRNVRKIIRALVIRRSLASQPKLLPPPSPKRESPRVNYSGLTGV